MASEGPTNPLREILEQMPRGLRDDSKPPGRAEVVANLSRLWHSYTEHRFGQMLVKAVERSFGASLDVDLRVYSDEQMQIALTEGCEHWSRREPLVSEGPYWDGETRNGGSFLASRPRDPGRIEPFLETLARVWEARSNLTLGELVVGGAGSSRVVLIEDSPLRRGLERLAGGDHG
jgi:hypothetical protein